jgi:glycosyltransferase involved in cell wall biosynthesis
VLATKRLVRKIAKIAPDIIHLHNIHGSYINYKILFDYLSQADIPVVWTLHDCWPMTGHCAHFEFAQCERWKSGCHHCPEQKSYPVSKFFDRSRKNYIEKREAFNSVKNMTMVPVSNWLGDIVKESFLNNYSVEVIHNGIDIATFAPITDSDLRERYGLADKRVILAVASPWGVRKGLDDLKRLSGMLPRDRYQMVVIGLNPKQLATLPDGIVGLQRTANVEELAAWYSLADVFVNPTYEDTYPTTNLEALSCGAPVVTYRTGGSPESVTAETGRVVERGDLEALVRAIDELCAEDRDAMRRRCRDYAEMHFDNRSCFATYLDLYEKLINKTK